MNKKFKSVIWVLIVLSQLNQFCKATEYSYKDDALEQGAKKYIKWMTLVGNSAEEKTYLEELPALFTKNCKKIENRKELFTHRDGFVVQLRNARKAVGPWTIQELGFYPCARDGVCITHFQWFSNSVPLHTTMVILKFNAQMLIYEIEEVYNQVDRPTLGSS